MRYTKRIAILFFSLLLMVGAAVTSAEAQRRVHRVYRPVIRPYWGWHDPFWRSWYYDPFYDPYYYDPAYREYRDRSRLRKDVANARKDLAKDREKYMKDGYIDPKEQEQLAKAERKYRERLAKLEKFEREH